MKYNLLLTMYTKVYTIEMKGGMTWNVYANNVIKPLMLQVQAKQGIFAQEHVR